MRRISCLSRLWQAERLYFAKCRYKAGAVKKSSVTRWRWKGGLFSVKTSFRYILFRTLWFQTTRMQRLLHEDFVHQQSINHDCYWRQINFRRFHKNWWSWKAAVSQQNRRWTQTGSQRPYTVISNRRVTTVGRIAKGYTLIVSWPYQECTSCT